LRHLQQQKRNIGGGGEFRGERIPLLVALASPNAN